MCPVSGDPGLFLSAQPGKILPVLLQMIQNSSVSPTNGILQQPLQRSHRTSEYASPTSTVPADWPSSALSLALLTVAAHIDRPDQISSLSTGREAREHGMGPLKPGDAGAHSPAFVSASTFRPSLTGRWDLPLEVVETSLRRRSTAMNKREKRPLYRITAHDLGPDLALCDSIGLPGFLITAIAR